MGFFVLLWGFGLGAWPAYLENNVSSPSKPHQIETFHTNRYQAFQQFHQNFGLFIVGLYCIMPLIGIFSHTCFQSRIWRIVNDHLPGQIFSMFTIR